MELSVTNLTFAYQKKESILRDISFTIKKGESIGIVGGSGSGKTTLIDLLLGLLLPSKGGVLCNNTFLNSNLKQWQSMVGYVQQKVFMLDDSIKNNIAFGIPDEKIDIERIELIVNSVRLRSWIETLENGLDSIVGERGARISGGQQQRIGIARALYHDPDILFFDEATSALDNATERKIMDDVYSMWSDKTIIIIAHRLESIRRCDRILVLDKGKLVGEGTYDELSSDNKVFKSIGLLN